MSAASQLPWAVTGGVLLGVVASAYGVLAPRLAGRLSGGGAGLAPGRARSVAGAVAGVLVLAAALALGVLPGDLGFGGLGGVDAALVVLGLALGCGEFAAAAFLAGLAADIGAGLRPTAAGRAARRLGDTLRGPRSRPKTDPARTAARDSRAPRPASAAGQTHWLGLARGHTADEARARVSGPGARWAVAALALAVAGEEAAFRPALIEALRGSGAVAAVVVAVLAHAALRVRGAPAGRRLTPESWVPALLVPTTHAVLYWRTGTLVPLLAADAAFLALLIPTERKRP
ncbi:type II CAAX prenyl endopeptidase Rce1 family protein [Streptomyces sp. NPDC005863]|uniref:CPBP family glutamic-type intramembrane protease n=1 Tax=unclassified Streptomyces TaxID=2593676 RepID=UPI00340A3633